MSNLLNRYFLNALLADAAYADIKDIIDGGKPDLSNALVDSNRFANGQGDLNRNRYAAEIIEANFTYEDQILNTNTGFSATLYKRIKSSSDPKYIKDDSISDYVIATRGTEVPSNAIGDLISADIGDIGLDGIALKQGVDLFNWYNSLSAPESDDVLKVDVVEGLFRESYNIQTGKMVEDDLAVQLIDQSIDKFLSPVTGYDVLLFSEDAPVKGSNKIEPTATIDVTGHSLGGHLATIMGRIASNRLGTVYSFNGPGFDPKPVRNLGSKQTKWFFEALREAQIQNGSLVTIGGDFAENKIVNIDVSTDQVHKFGFKYGDIETDPSSLEIYSDGKQILNAASHFMGDITETSEVYSEVSRIFPAQEIVSTLPNGIHDTS